MYRYMTDVTPEALLPLILTVRQNSKSALAEFIRDHLFHPEKTIEVSYNLMPLNQDITAYL
jgi:hypothetical protein